MKPKVRSNNNGTVHVSAESGLHEKIRGRAHEIWLARGCCHGDDVRHWLEAERQVLAEIQRQSRKRT